MRFLVSVPLLTILVFPAVALGQLTTAQNEPTPPAPTAPTAEPPPATGPAPATTPTPAAAQTAPAAPTPPATPAPTPAAAPTPAPASPAQTAPEGPTIELSTEHHARHDPDAQTPPESARFQAHTATTDGTTLGGYAELHFNMKNLNAAGDSSSEVDMHRTVLFVSHRFNEQLSFSSEIEVEHALAGDGKPGEVGIEQAHVDYLLDGKQVGLRAGIVLVPMGIINQWHEPPTFHGVERPNVDKVIIPSTWREAAVGLFGEPSETFRYELYVMSGLDASGFSASNGIRGGRQKVAEARADGVALAGRAEFEPSLGVVAGISGYVGEAGPNADFFDGDGNEVELNVPVYGLSGDLRARYEGLETRTVLAFFHVGDTDDMRNAFDSDGESLGIDMGESMLGMYIEFAYDLMYGSGTDHQLLPFVRAERYDTMLSIAGRQETRDDEALGRTDWSIGLSYRPIPQVAFKGDYIFKDTDGNGGTSGQFDLGFGVTF